MTELNQLTIKEALAGLRKKQFSAADLTKACLKRIKRIDQRLKAFITVCEEKSLAQAKKIDAKIQGIKEPKSLFCQFPLLGIPMAVKDNFCTKEVKTTAGSKNLENYLPVYDAAVVERLKKAGAIIIGKTNLDAWSHGSSTEASQFFTTKNPWGLDRLPGGSSGGSAAAIAADQAIGSVGSETAGSIRQPASWCGAVGFKPTYGRVSRYGLIAMGSSLDSPGPITKSVYDAALVLRVLAGQDEKDATTSPVNIPDYSATLKHKPDFKIGVVKNYLLKKSQKEVNKAVLQAVKQLERLGFKITPVDLLDPQYSVATYTVIQRSEVSSNLARYDGIRYGRGRSFFGDEAKRRIMLGAYSLSSGYYDQYYLKAQKVRTLICQDFERVFKKVDLLIAPASPSTALKIGASLNEPLFGELQDILFEASSLAGLPGISLPCGFSQEGLPIGMQLIGPHFKEEALFQAAQAYEQSTNWSERRASL